MGQQCQLRFKEQLYLGQSDSDDAEQVCRHVRDRFAHVISSARDMLLTRGPLQRGDGGSQSQSEELESITHAEMGLEGAALAGIGPSQRLRSEPFSNLQC